MGFLEDNNIINVVSIILTLTALIAIFIKRRFSYWRRKGVPYIEPSLPWGNASELMQQKQSFGQIYNNMYTKMRLKSAMHSGFYFLLCPQYIPLDPELIKHILQKDFHHFVDRGVYSNERHEPLNTNLFTMEGAKWKRFRSKLSPTFSSGKMKMMFPFIVEACNEFIEVLQDSSTEGAVEIKDLLARLTTDIIGTCAFGIECKSLRNPDAEFRKYGRLIFEPTAWQKVAGFFAFVLPSLMKFLGLTQLRKEVNDFFMSVIKQTVSYREQNNVHRNDFMDLLLQIKNGKSIGEDDTSSNQAVDAKPMAVEDIAGQAFVFFLAGFETSSSTMSFCVYELACNEEIQEKLRREVVSAIDKHDGHLTYEAVSEMPYMDMVVNETLRKYSPLPVLNRICVQDYRIPKTNITIEKGVQVIIPIHGLHSDPEYYPNPEVFDPNRFTEENRSKRHPFTYLPFGEGPRICVGMRFGLVQTKAGLALLLKNYKLKLDPRTPRPLKLDNTTFLTSVVGGIWVKVTRIDP